MNMHIFLRASLFESNKARPSWYSKENCFKNLFHTIQSQNINLTIIYDGVYRDSIYFKWGNFNYVEGEFNCDEASYYKTIEVIKKSRLDNDTIIYILEDDYIHQENWHKVLYEVFTELKVEIATLYDHFDKYSNGRYENLSSKIYVTKSCHWRAIPSTTNTFALKYGTFMKYIDIFENIWLDEEKFIALLERDIRLVSSIPGYATHCITDLLSPTKDWSCI